MRRSARLFLLSWLGFALAGCDGGETDDDMMGPQGGDEAPMMTADGPIPSEPEALRSWLVGGGYLEWAAESAPHPGAGPHFGAVRTFLNDEIVQSLDADAGEHPAGSATVKELYGDGDTVRGWSVSLKRQDDSAGGDGWYWFEEYDGSIIADGDGIGICVGCHGSGRDYVRIPYPLQ